MSKKGKNVTIKGILYEDGTVETKKDNVYCSKDKSKLPKFDEAGKEAVATAVASQTTQSGIQAVVAQVQTQAANLGASGLVAVGSAGAFQIEHSVDNYGDMVDIARPIVAELVETGTISEETIAVYLPADSKFQGKVLPVAEKVLGKPVGEYKKALDAEKNKSDEQKAIEKEIQKAAGNEKDEEKDNSES